MLTPVLLLAGLVDTVGFWAIALVAICGVVSLAWIGMRQLKIQPPGWVIEVFWVLVVVLVIVLAIGLLVSLAGGQPTTWLRGHRADTIYPTQGVFL